MTQIINTYLAALARHLSFLGEAEKQDTLDFYRDFLLNGDFHSQEEIGSELGEPQSLAAQIKNDHHEVADLMDFSTPAQTASDNYFLNFHVKKNPLRKRTLEPGEFSQVKISVLDADVAIHQGDSFKVEIADYSSRPIEAQVGEQTLLIQERRSTKEDRKILINWHTLASYVKITVPAQNSLTKISAVSKNGDVFLQNLALTSLNLDLKNGDFRANKLKISQELVGNFSDGDLACSQAKIAETTLNQLNGDLELERCLFNHLNLRNKDGDTSIKQCNLTLNIDSHNGDIEISRCQVKNENLLRTKNGDIVIKQLAPDVSLKVDTKNGEVVYRGASVGTCFDNKNNKSDLLRATSTNGDIVIEQ